MERNLAAVKAVLATVNGRIVDDSSSENKKELTLDGYNTWVYLKWRAENKAWVVTGYKENDKHSSVDDRQRAMNLAESYALNTFGGLERVGAALEYSIARVAREYKQNNANPFLKLDFSASMARVTQRSMELLEARGEEEVAQDIMADLKAACERLSVVLADDDVDARRGTGLKVYAEMQALWNPVAVFEDPDVDKGFIVITDILAPNFSPKRKTKKKNKDQQVRQMKQVMAVLELRADKNNAVITEVVSAYSADSTGKYKKLIEDGFLRYADTERALTWASAEGDSVLQLLTTALLHSGSGVILKDGLQNVNTDFSASMARVTQRSMELLEARSEEEVAQDIMADMRAACERLSVVLADDDVDARRGTGLKVYAEMQALMSAVRAALPEKYLRQGNLDMLLRWASVYAQMAQNGNVPARGTVKGKAFDMFVDALQRQAERDRLQGMTEEEARDALMEIASDKLETAFLKVARDSVRRLDQFLKDRALERIEWLYTHAYPTREDSKTKALVKKNVLVALHVGVTSSTDRKLIVSKIASAYGKNHIRTIINKHKILYWNDQKGKVMLNNYRLQLPQAIQHDLSTGNIWNFNDLVKYKQQNNFSFSMGRNLAAVHSLSPVKFQNALEQGGMPMPSVAVTRLASFLLC